MGSLELVASGAALGIIATLSGWFVVRTVRGAVLRSLALVTIGAAFGIMATLSGWFVVRVIRQRAHRTWGQILIVGDELNDGPRPMEGVGDEPQRRRPMVYAAEVYDPATNRFASPPPAMLQGRIGAAAIVIKEGPNAGKVLIAGGYSQEYRSISWSELYDPANGTFTMGAEMNDEINSQPAIEVRYGPKAGWILIAGTRPAVMYDPIANHFDEGPEMICDQAFYTATSIASGPKAGRILFAGGDTSPSPHDKGICSCYGPSELYDPATNAFEPGAPMNTGRYKHTATPLTSGPNAGKILLVGGILVEPFDENHPDRIVALASTEIYDPATNTFAPAPSETPTMKTARANHTATVISAGPDAGKILIAGGEQNDRTTLSSTELYDPTTNRFTPGPALHSPRTRHLAIPIVWGLEAGKILIAAGVVNDPDNRVACLGGKDCDFPPLDSTELYDPIGNRFISGPKMHGAPGQAIAVQLPSAPPPR